MDLCTCLTDPTETQCDFHRRSHGDVAESPAMKTQRLLAEAHELPEPLRSHMLRAAMAVESIRALGGGIPMNRAADEIADLLVRMAHLAPPSRLAPDPRLAPEPVIDAT